MDDSAPFLLPDSILYQIFLSLGPADLLSAGLVCRHWYAVSRDDFLWKELFFKCYGVQRHVHRYPGSDCWYQEFQRLSDTVPCVEVQRLCEHTDQVLHISFSHTGDLCASCSKDCTVKIWSTMQPLSLLHSANMRPHHWSYTQFSQFNADDSLLLVSGVFVGPHNSSAGEIAVFSLGEDGFNLLSRVRNKPYDVFGCWLNNTHLISGNLHRMGRVTSCSVLWLNKAFQDVESENLNVVKRLYKIQNLNASTIRMVMVAEAPDLLMEAGDQGAESPVCPPPAQEREERAEEEVSNEEEERDLPGEDAETDGGFQGLIGNEVQGDAEQLRPDLSEDQFETKVAQWYARYRTKRPDGKPQSAEETKKYLIFTTGCLTYSPHQIGIKQLLPHQMTTEGPVLGEERGPNEFFDTLDHVINIHGHIIGMGLSPDHRYLYVNSRSWPKDCVISDPMCPPPIAEEIELRVFDLKTLREGKTPLRAHRAYTPNNECFFIFLDVSRDFVASGAEDRCGYIWDRHYNVCLATLPHEDVVNSVAFCPVDQEMLLSASDDFTIKVWRSRRCLRTWTDSRVPGFLKSTLPWALSHKS